MLSTCDVYYDALTALKLALACQRVYCLGDEGRRHTLQEEVHTRL